MRLILETGSTSLALGQSHDWSNANQHSSPMTDGFPSQKASNAENMSIWLRRHGTFLRGSTVHAILALRCYTNSLYNFLGFRDVMTNEIIPRNQDVSFCDLGFGSSKKKGNKLHWLQVIGDIVIWIKIFVIVNGIDCAKMTILRVAFGISHCCNTVIFNFKTIPVCGVGGGGVHIRWQQVNGTASTWKTRVIPCRQVGSIGYWVPHN